MSGITNPRFPLMSEPRQSPFLDPTPGAKWWRVDFHTHTPFSSDAYNGENIVTERTWLIAHMNCGIDAVVVSDHNGGGWIDTLKQEYMRLETEGLPEFRPLALFPGVEITTSQNVHILVILDPSAPGSDISRVLQIARYRGTEGDHQTAADCGTVPLIEDLQAQGISSLVIPAHVNGAKGVLDQSVPFDTKQKTLGHSTVFALECHHPKTPDWDLRNLGLGNKGFSVVYGSDSHELSEIGRRTTWVRMEIPMLDGLRVALLDGITSVREYASDQDPGPHSPYFIERIGIFGTKYIGRKNGQTINLNPSFNAIIGGRGTGKSSILELVRAATKRGSSFAGNQADYARNHVDLIREITWGLPKDDDDLAPMVEVDYRQHGKTFRMRWHATPPSFELFALEGDGSETPVSDQGVWSERFPLRIFSQKQLYAFKEHTGPLLAEIDATLQVGGPAWQREWENKVAEFVQLSARIQQLGGEIAEREDLKAKITDLERQIEIMEAAGHKKVLRELSLRRRQGSELERWQGEVEPLPEALEELAERLDVSKLVLSRLPTDDPESSTLADEPEKALEAAAVGLKQTLTADAATLRQMASNMRALLTSFAKTVDSSDWEIVRNAGEEAYAALVDQLRGQKTKPEQYGELVQSRQILRKRLDGLDTKAQDFDKHKKTRVQEFKDLETKRTELSNKRREFLDSLFSSSANLRASLIPCGDIQAGITELRQILNRENNVAVEEFESFSGYLSSASNDEDRLKRVHKLKVKLWNLANEGQDGEPDIGTRIGKRFADHMKGRTTEDRTRLLAWFPPDLLKLRYKKDGSGSFVDLDKGSPGQVAAAVLAFLLAYGDEPILLDQPEDDLDNRLIYDLIVREIQTNKLRRQLLIITHNPNIVVNGNADLVIPLEDRRGRAEIPVMGALENPEVCKAVCDVMEGGREALERRFRRIVT